MSIPSCLCGQSTIMIGIHHDHIFPSFFSQTDDLSSFTRSFTILICTVSNDQIERRISPARTIVGSLHAFQTSKIRLFLPGKRYS